jgi:hypothetical protein
MAMLNYVDSFGKWSKLNESDLNVRSDEDINNYLSQLKEMTKLGLIEPSEIRAIMRKLNLEKLQRQLPNVNVIHSLPEYQELLDKGLVLVSSKTQLMNGNVILAYPGYNRNTRYALGFFSGIQVLRRMFPKGIKLGLQYRDYGSMDFIIKKFNKIPAEDFYRVAMRYALDKIDFTVEDPSTDQPYFPVKK